MTALAASRTTAERYLGWGRLAAGASLLISLATHVIGGYLWFQAVATGGGILLLGLGMATLLARSVDPATSRLVPVVGWAETMTFGIVIAAGPDEDVGYVMVLAMLMLILAALRGSEPHRLALYVVLGAEAIRQGLNPVIGQTIDPVESLVGVGLAAAVSSILVRMVELARTSEASARQSAEAARAALAEAEHAAEQLDVMHRVVASGIGTAEADALQRMVNEVSSYLGVPAATVFMLDDDDRPAVVATTDPHVGARDDVTPVRRGPFLRGPLARALQGHSTQTSPDELAAMADSGLPRHGAIVVHPLRRGDGTVMGALACGTAEPRTFTVTESRTIARFADQMSLAIEAARALHREADLADRYRELDRLKTDFVAITSHELRTPLTTVLGAIETMRQRMDELDRDEIRRLVEALSRQALRLSRLVDDLRTVSRVDAGTLHTLNRPTDVGRVMHDAAAGVPELDVRVTVDDGLPKIFADPDRLEQVVTNLLANGSQHGQGTIDVAAHRDGTQVAIQVWDEGMGVPPDRREDVFARFVRLGDTDSHSRGTGLGLAIARELTTAMGGTIAVVDRGEQAIFEVRLPFADPGQPTPG